MDSFQPTRMDALFLYCTNALSLVNIVSRTINEEINTNNNGGINVDVWCIPPTIYNIGDLRCRLRFFFWMMDNVHLRDFHQS